MASVCRLVRDLQLVVLLFIVFLTPEATSASTSVDISKVIKEEQPPGTVIVNILEFLRNQGRPVNNGVEINFQIFHSSPKLADRYFKITREDGQVSVNHRIDRDTLCSEIHACCETSMVDSECKLKLQIQSDKEYSFIISLEIVIQDINDNTPRWSSQEITREFSENSIVGEFRSLPLAIDSDSGMFSVQKYEILHPKPMEFDVSYDSSTSRTSKELKLFLKTSLDRETKDQYMFTLMAIDGGYPAKNGTVKIRVIVTDENDEYPIFEKSQYVVTISEDLKTNSEVIRVKATDRDAGSNGEVYYFISPFTDNKYRSLFNIDANEGVIRVARQLDYESEKEIQLTVVAQDKNTVSPKQGTTLVIIKLLDVNDEEPQINVKSIPLEIAENEPSRKTVAILTITDKDSGINGEVTCQLNDYEDMFGLEPLNANTANLYKLVTNRVLDREVDSVYGRAISVTIQCTDKGIPSKTARKIIPVQILDVNDNAPKFSMATYHHNVNEDTTVNSQLFELKATDSDQGKNALLSYWLNGTEHFKIHSDGRVYLLRPLDRETQDKHQFIVIAQDHGDTPLSGSATVVVTVDDYNDHKPRIEQYFHFNIPENFTTGKIIGVLNATDDDAGINAELKFTMISVSPASSYFHVDWKGDIILTRALDREEIPSFEFKVIVEDKAKRNPLSATTTVMVTVMDINDCKPRFLFPTQYNNTIYIPTDTPVSGEIARVSAVDNDADYNGRIFYYIRNKDNTHFHVDQDSGILRLVQSLTQETIKSPKKLVLVARDGGQPSREDTTTMTIAFKRSQKIFYNEQVPESNENMLIIVGLVSVTGIFVLILVLGIILLSCRRRCLTGFAGRRRREQDPSKLREDGSKTLNAQCIGGTLHYPKEATGYLSYQQESLAHSQHSLDSGKGGSSIDNNNGRFRGQPGMTFTGDIDHIPSSYQALTKSLKSSKRSPVLESSSKTKTPNAYESLLKRSRKDINAAEITEEQPPEYYGLTYTTVQHTKTPNEGGAVKYSPMVNASFV